MNTLIRVLDEKYDVSSGQKIIGADEYLQHKKAKDIVESAITKAKSLEKSACKAYEIQEDMGYEDGITRANKRIFQQMLKNSELAIQYLEKLEGDLTRLVIKAVENILGEFDNETLANSMVKKLLDTLVNENTIVLKAHTDTLHMAKKVLDEYSSKLPHLITVPDDQLNTDTIVVETPTGIIEGSVSEQLILLKEAVLKQVSVDSR